MNENIEEESAYFQFSVLCSSNLCVVIPPSGFIDNVTERSNRTRGAIVSPNHSAFVENRGTEEEREEEEEGETEKRVYRGREGGTTKAPI